MKEPNTEEKILIAAKAVFMQKGKAGSRTQEIADKAGINKALLHYYFRSKDQLFIAVFQRILRDLIPKLFSIFTSEVPLEVKIYNVAEQYIDFLLEHKELPLFILNELQTNPEGLTKMIETPDLKKLNHLQKQLEDEISKGNIRHISIPELLMNTISLMVFPFAAQAMFQHVFEIKEEQYKMMLKKRKTDVPKFIMNALRP